MKATGSNPVEPTNMDKRIETGRPLPFPEQKSPLPIGTYIDLIRDGKTIRTLLVKTDDPQDPYEAINPDTSEKIEMFSDEKALAFAKFRNKTRPTPLRKSGNSK